MGGREHFWLANWRACSASHSLIAGYEASCVQQEGKSRHVVDGHYPGRIWKLCREQLYCWVFILKKNFIRFLGIVSVLSFLVMIWKKQFGWQVAETLERWLGSWAAFPADPGLVPITSWRLTPAWNSSSRGFHALSWLCVMHVHTCKQNM